MVRATPSYNLSGAAGQVRENLKASPTGRGGERLRHGARGQHSHSKEKNASRKEKGQTNNDNEDRQGGSSRLTHVSARPLAPRQ